MITHTRRKVMRIVIALGSHALLHRSDAMTTQAQRRNARVAAQAIAPLAAEHRIVVAHGNSPQVSPLTRQAESYRGAEPCPLDVLDAGLQGMTGYLIQSELRNLLPPQTQVATVLTMITVDPDDPAFARPSTFVGPVYHQDASDLLAAKKGWTFRRDGTAWRRVVPSPEPQQILEIEPITWLLEHGAVVICAGGGGISSVHPTSAPGDLANTEVVIDKDLASEMIAEEVGADLFLMVTDVDGAGSMGSEAEAAARFAARTGKRAAIGSLADIPGIVAGNAGTNVIAPDGPRPRPGASGVRVTVGAQAGEATPRTTWSPPCGAPRPLAGAG
jgi:carbamate kinase